MQMELICFDDIPPQESPLQAGVPESGNSETREV